MQGSVLVFATALLVPGSSELPEVVAVSKVCRSGSLEPMACPPSGVWGRRLLRGPVLDRLVSTRLGRNSHGRCAAVDHAVQLSDRASSPKKGARRSLS